MKIEELYNIYLKSTGVTTDTRKIVSGNIFFALSGENFDGNAFAGDALNKGCTHAIIDKKEFAIDNRYILVNDCLTELQKLAGYHRSQLTIPLIGVTGTNGKTTTKELIASVLSQKYNVLYTQGNLNNHIGVPLTLLRITPDIEVAIIEMGANHPGEIEFLCNIANPNYGLITNIGKAHLEGFGGFEGVKRTKNELYKHLIEHEGTVFANRDNPILTSLLEGKKVKRIFYGNSTSSDCKSRNVTSDPYLEFEVDNIGLITTKLAGSYNLENALAAICIGRHFQVSPEAIKVALHNYEPSNQRSQIKKTDKNILVMDYYNANPSSMEAALENFEKMDHPKKAVILGDMLELGSETEFEHRKVINKLSLMNLDRKILVGSNFCSVSSLSSIHCFQTSEEARSYVENNPFQGYLILIKGSRGIKLENIAEKIG